MNIYFKCLRLFVVSLLLSYGTANAKKSTGMSQKEFVKVYSTDIDNINAYLSSLQTLQADFSQFGTTSRNGVDGVLYVDRVTKNICIDYITGDFHAKVISIKNKSYHVDKDINEISVMPSSGAATRVFFIKNIADGSVSFRKIVSGPNEVAISFVISGRQDEGLVTITFKKDPYLIKSIEVESIEDATKVKMTLKNQIENKQMDQKVFSINI